MKKNLFVILVLASFISMRATAQEPMMSDKAKKNLAIATAVSKMFETHDFSKIADYIADDVVDHSGPTGEIKGLDNIKAMFNQYDGMMKDVTSEALVQLADDNYVIMWVKQSWTAATDDPMMQMKKGDKGSMESVEITKHNADGKIIEHWSFMSMSEIMKMLPGMTDPQKKKD